MVQYGARVEDKWMKCVEGSSTDLMCVQMSVKLIFTIWIESVVSAPLGADMKGVIGEKKESRCEVM